MSSSPAEPTTFDGEHDEAGTMQPPVHDQLPSLEEIHQKSSLDLPSGTFEETKNTSRRRTWGYGLAIAIPFVIFGAIIAIVLVINKANNPEELSATVSPPQVRATAPPTVRARATRTPTARTKTRRERAVAYLELLSDPALFEDDLTPQARALAWIVEEDLQVLDVPALDGIGKIGPGSAEREHRFPQRYALAVLYYAMAEVIEFGDTDNWRREFNFLSGKNECEWHEELEYVEAEQVIDYGVACDWQGRVTSIYMPKNRLEGTIPPEIALLSQLQVLNLSENRLYGPLPPEMSNLVNLEVFLIAMNDIDGTIPDYLNALTNLKKLSLLDNMFTGTLPDLGNLKQLTHLDLSNQMDLKGTIPASWGGLTALRGLFLSFNELEGTLPAQLGGMKNLRDLRLTSNYFEGTLPDYLKECMHLKNLYLDDNELTGDLHVLGYLAFLEGIFLADNAFAGGLDVFVDFFDDLMILDASNNQLTGTLPPALFRKEKLKVLDLNDNSLEDILPDFPDNNALEYLALQANLFTNDVPVSVSNLRALTHLDLSKNKLTGSLPASMGDMDLLTYLNLSTNFFDSVPLPAFLQRLTSLKELSLGDMDLFGTIPSWMEVLKGLVYLDLGDNALSGTVPAQAFTEMQNLTFVQLAGNGLEGVIPKVFATLPKLQVLTVGSNSFNALEDGFCEREEPSLTAPKSVFSGDCDMPYTQCFSTCCTNGKCPDLTEKLMRGKDLQWDHTYGYWFSMNERIVYDVRPMIEAGELVNKDSYAQYNMLDFDYGIDDDDDGYFDDDVEDLDDDVYDEDDFFDDDVFDDDEDDDFFDIVSDDDDLLDDEDPFMDMEQEMDDVDYMENAQEMDIYPDMDMEQMINAEDMLGDDAPDAGTTKYLDDDN